MAKIINFDEAIKAISKRFENGISNYIRSAALRRNIQVIEEDVNDRYDYQAQLVDDIWERVFPELDFSQFSDWDDLYSGLNDRLFVSRITGNDCGSYFCSTWKAENAIAHNWDLIRDVHNELGTDLNSEIEYGAEDLDVSIRVMLLPYAIDEFIAELKEILEELEIEEAAPDIPELFKAV